ncbi:TonB-dependent receptor [Fulvivirga lutea]|uniref:TonB-dependent receptor n=1 Tax=Fulvivirga lutea TaxID=2810512 RepID=A0A974WID1_9BACT|nr:TonB-dependent receptor [Fulvivirga lutea]QSE98318.1 TonB-dependent receptor [Fulvivirga lutea]
MKNLVLTILLSIASLAAIAQKGIIRGTVLEGSTGEPMFGVTVIIEGTSTGAVTDFDGKFEIKTAPGTYNVQASFISYAAVTITGVEVVDGEVTILDRIIMQEDVEQLAEVVITAEAIRNTEEALQTVKRKSANVLDGISAASFRKIGDGDAGAAAKRVTGVSVEGGKYIYVRGLGDRYTKTTQNGMDIPGLDPDRNSIQIDVYPTNLIDNMVILKTFTPELPADFTGGIVNIETKDFPEEKILDVSFGMEYNPSMHFNNNYITYDGGSTDWLGYDDGTRGLPTNVDLNSIPTPLNAQNDQEVANFLNQFSPTMGVRSETSFMNYSFGLTAANQFELKNGHNIGYLFTGNYKNNTTFYDDAFYGEYQNDLNDRTRLDFQRAFNQSGIQAENNVLLGGLAGLAYKTNLSKFRLTMMRLQNGESTSVSAEILDDQEASGKSGYTGISEILEYNERKISNIFLNGEHHLGNNKWTIDWRGSTTWSTQEDPDIRQTAFTRINDNLRFAAGAAGNPTRIWRELDEINVVGKVDVTRDLEMFGNDAKLKFGVSQIYKERDYRIVDFNVNFLNGEQLDWTGSGLEVWTNETVFPAGNVFLVSGFSNPNPNEYNANATNSGVYFSTEFSPLDKLKAIIGVRAENFTMRHTGRDQGAASYIRSRVASGATMEEAIGEVKADEGLGRVLDNDIVLDALDFFPSVNLIYGITEEQNLRLSYSKTIARPSFKELSFAQIFDPVSNRIFNGGLFAIGNWDGNLVETRIDNIDLRWELFMGRGQTYSISAFYKSFENPIELVRIPQQRTNVEYQPRNVGDGQLFGMEFEFRKALDFISPNWSVNGNVTIVESIVDMQESELINRRANAREGEVIDETRNMSGQAPWIINAGLAYNNFESGFDAGLFYNVKGETLIIVGGGLDPDVFSQPFHSLNFNMNKTFGAKQQWVVNFGVSNILNDKLEQFYKRAFSNLDNSPDATFQRLNPGMAISAGVKYSF